MNKRSVLMRLFRVPQRSEAEARSAERGGFLGQRLQYYPLTTSVTVNRLNSCSRLSSSCRR